MTTSTAAKKPSKTAFVRALPADMSAKDVVAKAKGAGLKISEAYVYTIRSSTRARKGGAPNNKAGGAKRGPGRPPGSKNRASGGARVSVGSGGARSVETSFRKLVLDLGIRRSRELLDDVESKLQRLIAGS